ncbi:MAG: hypothetical protein PWP23_490 [Candidatus Sumerlaeota bacterium]|nr:hypothetical protein [Candidatus Sumerlaeota bacterium]
MDALGFFMSSELDYYRLLNISRDAPEREIKKAYYELARKLHPDKAKDEDERATNASKLAAISKAYNTLKDPRKRAEYDQQIRGKTATNSDASSSSGSVSSATPIRRPGKRQDSTGRSTGMATVSGIPDGEQNPEEASKRQNAVYQQKKSMAQKAFVKGMQYFKVADYKQALNFFEVTVQNDPESEPQYHLKYAQCLMRTKGSFTKAAEHAEMACQLDPYNLEFKLALGDVYEQAGVNSKAKEIYEDVLRWDATNREAKNRLQLLGNSGGGGGAKGVLDKIVAMFSKKK